MRKTLWLVTLATLQIFAVGCSGINASKSVSPIDFLIPGGPLWRGLLYAPPPAPPASTVALAPATETPEQVASVR